MKADWLKVSNETVGIVKHLLSNLSIKVRTDQYRFFDMLIKPDAQTKILDVGATSDEILKDSNLFEKLYPFPKKLTAATIEDEKVLRKLYQKISVVKIKPGKSLPYKNKQFDVAVSWATIEHVGNHLEQKFFLSELLRVAKKIYVTTPYRGCVYEPHTGFFFLHWLPLSFFYFICKVTGKKVWATEENLNPLFTRDIYKMFPNTKLTITLYKMFGFLPSHLIITI